MRLRGIGKMASLKAHDYIHNKPSNLSKQYYFHGNIWKLERLQMLVQTNNGYIYIYNPILVGGFNPSEK